MTDVGGGIVTFGTLLQNAVGAVGNGAVFNCGGLSSLMLTVTITNTATVVFEGSMDGNTYFAVSGYNSSTFATVSGATSTGRFIIPLVGLRTFRCRVSAWTSGTVTASGVGSVEMAWQIFLALLSTGSTTPVPPSGSTNALSRVSSTAQETSHVIKASPGRLFLLTGYSSAAQFIQVHNTISLPADAAVPIYSEPVSAGAAFNLDLTQFGDYFSTGITVCNSSTQPAKTIGGSTCWFNALFV